MVAEVSLVFFCTLAISLVLEKKKKKVTSIFEDHFSFSAGRSSTATTPYLQHRKNQEKELTDDQAYFSKDDV